MSRNVDRRSTATMSVLGIMISRTVLSPISMMPWIIWCSCSSITPCSSETWSTVSSSSSVRYGARPPRPPVIPRETIVTAHRIGLRNVATRSTGPAAASAQRSACAMASVLGVTSATISKTTDSSTETSSVNHRRHPSPRPARVRTESAISAVAVDATISASVLVNSTVDRNRLGSARRRCRITPAWLPCSARNRTRKRPTEVSAVSVPLASAAMTRQANRTMSSANSCPFMEKGLSEELADAPVLVYPDDRLSEERCHRQHFQRGARLLGRDWHCVGHDHLFHVSFLQSLHCVAGQNWMRRRDQHAVGALRAQRQGKLGDGAAGRDDVLDHDAVPPLDVT